MAKRKRRYVSTRKRPWELKFDLQKGVYIVECGSDYGPIERRRQQGGVVIVPRHQTQSGVVTAKGAIAVGENVLELLFARGSWSPRKSAGGTRLPPRSSPSGASMPARNSSRGGSGAISGAPLALACRSATGAEPPLPVNPLGKRDVAFWMLLDACAWTATIVWGVLCGNLPPRKGNLAALRGDL